MPNTSSSNMEDAMQKYHSYLAENYEGGCERFFSPTGFLKAFERSVDVRAQKARNHVFVKDVDEAAAKLEPVVAGGEGVFDLTAEPGAGKTSVLPFRFPSKKVIVALPTPFDAWSAYNMATGVCSLKLKGLELGARGSNVTYTDSYMAAYALLSNYLDYDIIIVDECDSDRGVSKFLAEVKTKGKLLIRMSATHGRKTAGLSRAFRVTETEDMPDIRTDKRAVAGYVKERHTKRSLVLAPDADAARQLVEWLPDAILVTVETRLDVLARTISNQEGDNLYVSDDTCGRALNLNLDAVFDCQLVTEYGDVRPLTPAELYQRKNRVGRNREGWYYSSGISARDKGTNDFDIARHNVVRAVARVDQEGSDRLRVTEADANLLMCSSKEPYGEIMRRRVESSVVTSSSGSSGNSPRSYVTTSASRPTSPGDDLYSQVSTVKAPAWLAYFSGYSTGASDSQKSKIADTFVISNSRGAKAFERRKSSGSSSSGTSSRAQSSVVSLGFTGRNVVGHRAGPSLPSVDDAPYAVSRRSQRAVFPRVEVPHSPPVMDLTQLTYDMDWPALIRDRLAHGGDLPRIVPNGSWRHTSASGLGTDWFRRVDDMAVTDNTFEEDEFEVVVRAWNKLVAQAWVKRTPGLSNAKDTFRLEYCVRYFQAYFDNGTVG